MDTKEYKQLNQLISIAGDLVDVVSFVDKDFLEKYGNGRGMFGLDEEQNKMGIYIDKSLNSKDKVITLAHEVGHAKDYLKNDKGNVKLFRLRKSFVGGVVKMERLAWIYSVQFLKQVGFTDWEYFVKTVKFSLSSHNNNVCNFEKEEIFWERLKKELIGNVTN